MTLNELKATIGSSSPPRDVAPVLRALWHDARGDWEAAHRIVQDIHDANGAWVHAYLHRKQGDLANAGYWYLQAAKPVASGPTEDEWDRIAMALLG